MTTLQATLQALKGQMLRNAALKLEEVKEYSPADTLILTQ